MVSIGRRVRVVKKHYQNDRDRLGKPLQPGKLSTKLEPQYTTQNWTLYRHWVTIVLLLPEHDWDFAMGSELGRIDIPTQEVGPNKARFSALLREVQYCTKMR